MDNDLFVVVSWEGYTQCLTSILQLERGGINHEYDPCTQEAPVVQSEFSATFRLPLPPPPRLPLQWGYALQADTEASLHIVPNWSLNVHLEELHSCIFNLKTKKCKRVLPPHTSNYGGQFVSLGPHAYFFPHPCKDPKAPDPVLERYDPLIDEWKKLEPIPKYFMNGFPHYMANIRASAVWDDTILLNLFESQFCAYNVTKKKWYQVMLRKPRDCAIQGDAFVIGDTIYALSSQHFSSVAVLTIKKVENNDDLVYSCYLSKIITVPGEEAIEFDYAEESRMSRHLVHLGEDHFCLVHSSISRCIEKYQHIQLTHIKLKGKHSISVTNKSVHQFKLEPKLNAKFEVRHCFSLPKCKTTDLKQGQTSFEFDPFPESFLSRLSPKDTDYGDIDLITELVKLGHRSQAYKKASLAPKASTLGVGAALERSNTDEEGHSICVVKLSSEATVRQLVRELERYGPVMKVQIHVPTNAMRKPCAYVEFENADAKQFAIEASPIIIGGRRAVIQNIRRNACEGDVSNMAESAAVVAPRSVSAQVFGNAFVQQYYHILHHSPALLHRFYQDISMLVRTEDDGSLSVTTSVNAINEKILSLSYGDLRAEIKSVDAQESFHGFVQVSVTGYLRGIDNQIRNFSQCFLVAPQDQGFLVLHDIFRYVESSSQPHGEMVLVDDVKVEDPVSQEQIGVFVPYEGDLSDMAEAAAVVAPQPLSAQFFGNVFVREYYHILHHSPALVHRFYQDTSVLVRPEDDGSLSFTTSVNAINEKILSLNSGDCRAEIKIVDTQESFRGAVQVFVTGYLLGVTGINVQIRQFFQCFLLAPQDQGFLVLYDIFHYVESSSQPHGEHVLVDDVVVRVPVSQEQCPVPPAVQESHVSDEGNHVDEVTEGQVLNPPENGDVPIVEEEVNEVVDEVQDDSPPVVESYAAIVKRSPFSSPAPVPRKSHAIVNALTSMSQVERSPFSSPAPVPRKSQESEGTIIIKKHMFLFSGLLIAFLWGIFWCSWLLYLH